MAIQCIKRPGVNCCCEECRVPPYPEYQKPTGYLYGVPIEMLSESIGLEYHWFLDVLNVPEDTLDSQWLDHMLSLLYPNLDAEARGVIIQHVGWH